MGMITFIEYEELRKKLLSIPDQEHQGFLCLTYLCLGRVGEVLRHKKDTKYIPEEEWKNPPISCEQVKMEKSRKGRSYLAIYVRTEKVNQMRKVPILKREQALVRAFMVKKKQIRTGFLYDYSVRWGEKVFYKYFKTENIHSLRHWRITHLLSGAVTGKPVPNRAVARMSGHQNLNTQATYDHTIVDDYIDML